MLLTPSSRRLRALVVSTLMTLSQLSGRAVAASSDSSSSSSSTSVYQLGYVLPPYGSGSAPSALGKIVHVVGADGRHAASMADYSPPPSAGGAPGAAEAEAAGSSVRAVRLGLLADQPSSWTSSSKPGFAANTVLVSAGVLGAGSSSGAAAAAAGGRSQASIDACANPETVFTLHVDPVTNRAWNVGVEKRCRPADSTGKKGSSADAGNGAAAPRVEVSSGRPAAGGGVAAPAPAPVVNKPVVLSKEGKVEEPPQERTFLQKYWWILLGLTFILMTGGGGK